MNSISRVTIGIVGGLVAASSKILALDAEKLAVLFEQGNIDEINSLKVTIFVVTPILLFLGGVIAWATSEESRIKLLAIGCAAPAIIAPWTAQAPFDVTAAVSSAHFGLTSTAYAQNTAQRSSSRTVTGLKVLFGIADPNAQKYWVIVGSHANLKQAEKQAKVLNAADPGLRAFVGQREPGNTKYPVIIGGPNGYLPLAAANKLKARAMISPLVSRPPNLSSYPGRLPAMAPSG